jgi:hypothetical protein
VDAYLTILFVIHILGAIAGIGPTFAFGIIGPNAGKAGPVGGAALLNTLLDIEKKIVTPVVLFTQPLSGVLLIFKIGYNHDFFSHYWLWIAILLFATILYLSYLVDTPAIHRVVKWMESGPTGPPPAEVKKDIDLAAKLGPLFGIMTVTIIILMVWKPGS